MFSAAASRAASTSRIRGPARAHTRSSQSPCRCQDQVAHKREVVQGVRLAFSNGPRAYILKAHCAVPGVRDAFPDIGHAPAGLAGSQRRRQRCAIARCAASLKVGCWQPSELTPDTTTDSRHTAIGQQAELPTSVAAGRFVESARATKTTCASSTGGEPAAHGRAANCLAASRQRRTPKPARGLGSHAGRGAAQGSPRASAGKSGCCPRGFLRAVPSGGRRIRAADRRRDSPGRCRRRCVRVRDTQTRQREVRPLPSGTPARGTSSHQCTSASPARCVTGLEQRKARGRTGSVTRRVGRVASAGQPSETCGPVHTSADDGDGRCVGRRRSNPDRSHQHRIEARAPARWKPVDR